MLFHDKTLEEIRCELSGSVTVAAWSHEWQETPAGICIPFYLQLSRRCSRGPESAAFGKHPRNKQCLKLLMLVFKRSTDAASVGSLFHLEHFEFVSKP